MKVLASHAPSQRRLRAELYALTHRGNPGDSAFYARVCRGASRVLELGAGYGRLLPRLAQTGRTVVGLDLDADLLALARHSLRGLSSTKRGGVRLVRADMRDFRMRLRFQRVLLPYNGLYCMLTKRSALACLRAARAVLASGGVFAFDVWNAEAFHGAHASRPSEDDGAAIVSLQHRGGIWDVFEHSRVWRARQRLDVTYTYLARGTTAAHRIPIAQRYFLAAELGDLLRRAGFMVEARYGDFSGARFNARSPHLVVVARAI